MPIKKPLTIRANENLLEKIKIIAQKENRSLNSQIEYLLQKGVSQYEKNN